MSKFIIEVNVLNALINYLKAKPYEEVAGLIDILGKVAPYKERDEKENPEEKKK